MTAEENDTGLDELLIYIKEARGFDFTSYKKASLTRRLRKRMDALGIPDFTSYRDQLEVDQGEFTQLFNYILINVTGFFRDAETWQFLQENVIPELLENKADPDPIRVWCAGSSSGEEAFSVAILLAEALGKDVFMERVKIYGTDVDDDALAMARQATYGPKEVEPIPPELLNKYFDRIGGNFVFDKNLRRAIIFGRHDLMQDAPISRVDLLLCRNTLMYFKADAQAQIVGHFYFALNDGGYLILGKAEMMFAHTKVFTPVELRRRVFTKASGENLQDRLLFAVQAGDPAGPGQLTNHIRGRDAAFESGPVAQLVVDRRGYLVLANARARQLFDVSRKDMGRPFQDFSVSYKPVELRSDLERVTNQRTPVTHRDILFASTEGELLLDVQIDPLVEYGGILLGVSISFFDVTRYRSLQEALEHSNQELETAMEELQSTNEELETTNEELQSTNEELETTNEELQSTNEELETMNEELQSTNEELETMNDELRDRTTDLNRANSFLESVLSSVRAGLIVVDGDQRVLAWNNLSEDLWGLREEEVLGEKLAGLDIGLPIGSLRAPIQSVISGSSPHEEFSLEATNRRGKQVLCRITLAPFTVQGQVPGAIVLVESDGSADS